MLYITEYYDDKAAAFFNVFESENNKIFSLDNDGQYPEYVSCPYRYLTYDIKGKKPKKQNVHLMQMQYPDSMEVDVAGFVLRERGKARAGLIFAGDSFHRNIQCVVWNNDEGKRTRWDNIDIYGIHHNSIFYNTSGEGEMTVYYDAMHREIMQQYSNGQVLLLENGVVYDSFSSKEEFYKYMILCLLEEEVVCLEAKMIKYLDTEDIQGKKVMVLLYNWNDLNILSENWNRLSGDIHVLCISDFLRWHYMVRGGHTHYPCKRLYMGIPQLETKVKPERSLKDILILTPSQNLKHIEQLIKGLPDYTFHIAADTMVSEYVQNLGKIGDVEVLPCISNDKLNELLNKCAFYLDINDLYTIHEAVPTVIAHGAIALSFDTDIHYRELMCPDLIFKKPEDMIASIRSLSTSKEVFEEKRKEQIQLFENWKPNKEVFQ